MRPRPRLAIITTGSEVARKTGGVGPARIRDANGPMLAALTDASGAWLESRQHASDTLEELQQCLKASCDADIVVLSGGVSAGKYDLVPKALEAHGARAVFHKVWQKPGKPLFFATRENQLIFGLPGTPLGSLCTFHRYCVPAIRKMMGIAPEHGRFCGTLSKPSKEGSKRPFLLMAHAVKRAGGWELEPLPGRGSSDINAPARANACIAVPEGGWTRNAGDQVAFEFIGGGYDGIFACR